MTPLIAFTLQLAMMAMLAGAPPPGAPMLVAEDVSGVEEPTTIAVNKVDITAFIRRVSVPPAAFHVRDEWSYRAGSGVTSSGQFALPGTYSDSSDPVLAQNANSRVVYTVGRAMNRDASNNSTNPASIRVWQSGDGGYSWLGNGFEVDMMPAGATRTVDKPWIAVSPEGYVYIAWVRVDLTGNQLSEIMFRRSRSAVVKPRVCCGRTMGWDRSAPVSAAGDVTAPQIVIDRAGYVYVIWSDFGMQQLRIVRSRHPAANLDPDGATVFDVDGAQTIATFNRINSDTSSNTIAGGIRVLPIASAQYNTVTNEILVTWTEGETDQGSHTDVRLARATAGATMTFSDVSLPGVNTAAADQFTPAVGVDEAGNVLLAYYDRASSTTTDYQEHVIKLTSAGSLTSPDALGPLCRAATVGEYQGLSRGPSDSGPLWYLAWACSDPDATPPDQRAIFQIAIP